MNIYIIYVVFGRVGGILCSLIVRRTGLEVIIFFSCSIQLSTKFQLLIITKIPTIEEVFGFKSFRCCALIMLRNVKIRQLLEF